MTQIDFYQIETAETVLMFTCRLIDKIYHQGLRIHIHTESQAQSEALDDLLWSFRPNRFIPHAVFAVTQGLDPGTQDDDFRVTISHQIEPGDQQDILVNLSGSVPGFFSRFERVVEVVPFDESKRITARENYTFYQDKGCLVHYHAIKARQLKSGISSRT